MINITKLNMAISRIHTWLCSTNHKRIANFYPAPSSFSSFAGAAPMPVLGALPLLSGSGSLIDWWLLLAYAPMVASAVGVGFIAAFWFTNLLGSSLGLPNPLQPVEAAQVVAQAAPEPVYKLPVLIAQPIDQFVLVGPLWCAAIGLLFGVGVVVAVRLRASRSKSPDSSGFGRLPMVYALPFWLPRVGDSPVKNGDLLINLLLRGRLIGRIAGLLYYSYRMRPHLDSADDAISASTAMEHIADKKAVLVSQPVDAFWIDPTMLLCVTLVVLFCMVGVAYMCLSRYRTTTPSPVMQASALLMSAGPAAGAHRQDPAGEYMLWFMFTVAVYILWRLLFTFGKLVRNWWIGSDNGYSFGVTNTLFCLFVTSVIVFETYLKLTAKPFVLTVPTASLPIHMFLMAYLVGYWTLKARTFTGGDPDTAPNPALITRGNHSMHKTIEPSTGDRLIVLRVNKDVHTTNIVWASNDGEKGRDLINHYR